MSSVAFGGRNAIRFNLPTNNDIVDVAAGSYVREKTNGGYDRNYADNMDFDIVNNDISRDNLYLLDGGDPDTAGAVVWTKTTAADNYAWKEMPFYNFPNSAIDFFQLKKNDKPRAAASGEIVKDMKYKKEKVEAVNGFKYGDYKDYTKVKYEDSIPGRACPGITDRNKYGFIDADTIRCIYDFDDVNRMSRTPEVDNSSVRQTMYTDLVTEFCKDPANVNKVVNSANNTSKTCIDNDGSKAVARAYCSTGNKMVTDKSTCSMQKCGTGLYHELATNYCEANPNDAWCGCYNTYRKKCSNPNFNGAGCDKARTVLSAQERLKTADPASYGLLVDNIGCVSTVCPGDGYSPENLLCNIVIPICNMDINIGKATNSTVNANCDIDTNITNTTNVTNITAPPKTVTDSGSGSGSGSPPSGSPPSGSPPSDSPPKSPTPAPAPGPAKSSGFTQNQKLGAGVGTIVSVLSSCACLALGALALTASK